MISSHSKDFLEKHKNGIAEAMPYWWQGISDSPLNLVGTEASGTSVHMARSTVDNRLDTLDIGLDSTVGTSVGVGDLDTKGNALATIITLRHFVAPPIGQISFHVRSMNA